MEHQAIMVQLVQLALPDLLVSKDLSANLVLMVILVQRDPKVNQDLMALLVPLVRMDILELTVRFPGHLDRLDPLVLQATMVHLEKMASPALLVFLEKTESLVLLLT